MKKLDSKQRKETLEEEVKRLGKENKRLSSKNDKQKDVIGKLRKDLKKRTSARMRGSQSLPAVSASRISSQMSLETLIAARQKLD